MAIEIVEGKKFQVKTDKKIYNTDSNPTKWQMNKETKGWLAWTSEKLNANACNDGYFFSGNEGFLQRAGVLTFLKTSTQLKVWFDDVLEVTWVFENSSDQKCFMKNELENLKFKFRYNGDSVSTHYRYEQGNLNTKLIYSIVYSKVFNKI